MVTLELVYILLCAEFISADDDGDVRAGTSLHDRHHRRRSTIARLDRRRTARRTASSLGHVRQDQSVLIEVAIPYLPLCASRNARISVTGHSSGKPQKSGNAEDFVQ